jgi:hypothetical protein
MVHLPLKSAGKVILPCVVDASNAGAGSPMRGIELVLSSIISAVYVVCVSLTVITKMRPLINREIYL